MKLVSNIPILVVGLLPACGNVIVDGSSAGTGTGGETSQSGTAGSSGIGGATTQPSATSSGGGSCSEIPATLYSNGDGFIYGNPMSCRLWTCEENGAHWSALCQGSTCECWRDKTKICTCNNPGTDNICLAPRNQNGAPATCCFPNLTYSPEWPQCP